MKKNLLFSLVTCTALSLSALSADTTVSPKELKAIDNADVPIKHYFAFGPAGNGKVTKQQLEYYKSIGLLKKHQAVKKELQKIQKNAPKPSQEIIDGVASTIEGVAAIEKNDLNDAQKYLQKAVDFFDTALKKNPGLKLLPVAEDIDITAHDIMLDEAKKIKEEAIKLLKENKPQEAITILSTLINQITITDEYIPMERYPAAVKKSLSLVKTGKKEAALTALQSAFNAVVSTTTIIPISLAVSEMALEDAQKLSSDKKEQAKTLLKLAKEELALAQLEGYLSSQDETYKQLSTEITKLQKRVDATGLQPADYNEANKQMNTLITNARKPKTKE